MMLPDTFINQDSPAEMYREAGLSPEAIETKVLELLGVDVVAFRRA